MTGRSWLEALEGSPLGSAMRDSLWLYPAAETIHLLGLATLVDVLVAYFFTRSAVHLLARTRLFSAGRFIGMRAALGVDQ